MQAAVDSIVSRGIDSFISFNEYKYEYEYEYRPVEKERLAKAGTPIECLHLKLGDLKSPTLPGPRPAPASVRLFPEARVSAQYVARNTAQWHQWAISKNNQGRNTLSNSHRFRPC